MLGPAALRRTLPTLPRAPRQGPWYRAVAFDLLGGPPPGAPSDSTLQPLWAGGAARKGARFTPKATPRDGSAAIPAIDCLYLAEGELTPLLEVTGVFRPPGSPVQLAFEPLVLMTVQGAVSDVLDLTDRDTQRALGTSTQELTGSWLLDQSRHLKGDGPLPATQSLALEAFLTERITALRYPSSKQTEGVGLVIFTARLRPGRDIVQLYNHRAGRLQQRLP